MLLIYCFVLFTCYSCSASLALFDTGISGTIPDLSALQKLEVFRVDNCKLVGDGYTYLHNVPSLKVLGIAGNEFVTGTLSGIEQLVNLEELYIGKTKMDGPLPEELGQLTKLKSIESSATAFTGVIPASIGDLVNLETLDLSLNQLSGGLPEEIGQLTKLEMIALYGNGEPRYLSSLTCASILLTIMNQQLSVAPFLTQSVTGQTSSMWTCPKIPSRVTMACPRPLDSGSRLLKSNFTIQVSAASYQRNWVP